MARFFIDRPIFAWVIAIVIMLAGGLAITGLPVSMYPTVAPPAVEIRATYPGASAQVVSDSVTQVIEQNMTGLDGLMYFSSQSSSNGIATVSLTFETGTDPDIAQVQVQNQLQLAMPLLPQEVQRQGVNVAKSTSGFLQVVGFVSEDGSMDRVDLADYVTANVVDPISRVEGVGNIQVFGGKYAMRIWLDPNKLHTYQLSIPEVVSAIQGQNAQVAIGALGGAPAVDGQMINATINAQDRLETPEEFRDIVVRASPDGSVLRLGDVARVEMGTEMYEFDTRYNRQQATGVAISMATGANALDTAAGVQEALAGLEPYFPPGLKAVVPFDTTPFVKVSIRSVISTLIEAIILVFLVMYLFLQNFRATLIPTIAVPVVLLGTFAVMLAFGFTINTLTMFGMVLAIGLLVDDAIVVVENVERVMHEDGSSPREATRKSMGQITGALVGIALVLSAVFVPMAFFGGSTGVIYRQFSITVVTAMVLSVVVALTLSPALCATMLKPVSKDHYQKKGFFGWFNRNFDRATDRYQSGVSRMLNRTGRSMLVYLVIVVVLGLLFSRLPGSFLPDEDQGLMFAQVNLPVGATKERSIEVMDRVEKYFLTEEAENVESVFSVIGFSFSGRGQNAGIAFVRMRDWKERTRKDQDVQAVAARAMEEFSQFQEALVYAVVPPAIPQLGTATGFNLQLQDLGGLGHEALMGARNQLLALAAQDERLMGVRPNGQRSEEH